MLPQQSHLLLSSSLALQLDMSCQGAGDSSSIRFDVELLHKTILQHGAEAFEAGSAQRDSIEIEPGGLGQLAACIGKEPNLAGRASRLRPG